MRKIITSVTLKAFFYVISSPSVGLLQLCSVGSVLPLQALKWKVLQMTGSTRVVLHSSSEFCRHGGNGLCLSELLD